VVQLTVYSRWRATDRRSRYYFRFILWFFLAFFSELSESHRADIAWHTRSLICVCVTELLRPHTSTITSWAKLTGHCFYANMIELSRMWHCATFRVVGSKLTSGVVAQNTVIRETFRQYIPEESSISPTPIQSSIGRRSSRNADLNQRHQQFGQTVAGEKVAVRVTVRVMVMVTVMASRGQVTDIVCCERNKTYVGSTVRASCNLCNILVSRSPLHASVSPN
jgi:hypothetical protein